MTPPLCAPDSVRGITVRQPWAACILHGGKRIENRPRAWAPGWYLLHAGAEVDRAALRSPLVARAVRGLELPTRAVLGLVRITGTHTHADTDVEPCSPWVQPQRFHMDLGPRPPAGRAGPVSRPARPLAHPARSLVNSVSRGSNVPGWRAG